MGMAAPVYYTADMVRALPDDGNRYETVYGELLVTPAPRLWHQQIVARLLHGLAGYAERVGSAVVLTSPADISWGDDSLVQPDVFVCDREQARTLDWKNVRTLHLVIEVLSRSTARYDRFTKRRLYQDVRIPNYWIVDADRHVVEIWTPDDTMPRVETERVIWRPTPPADEFVLALEDLFRPI